MTQADHDFDDAMRARFHDAMSELGHAHQAPLSAGRRTRHLPRGLRAGAQVLAVLALGAVPAYAAGRATAPSAAKSAAQSTVSPTESTAGAAQSTSIATAPTFAPTMAVQDAIKAALSDSQYVKSVSRIQVKLVTYADFEHVWSAGVTGTGACGPGVSYAVNGQEYVVAMSGDFLTPSESPHPALLSPGKDAHFVDGAGSRDLPLPRRRSSHASQPPTGRCSSSWPRATRKEARTSWLPRSATPASWPPCFDQLTDLSH
jgi:hypothetical protein